MKYFYGISALLAVFFLGVLFSELLLRPWRASTTSDVYSLINVVRNAMNREWTAAELKKNAEEAIGKQFTDDYTVDGWSLKLKTNPITGQGYHTVIWYEVDKDGIVRRAWLEFPGEGFL